MKSLKLEQTLKQKLKKDANVSFRNKRNKLQCEFNLEQLAKLEEAKSLLEISNYEISKISEVISEMQKRNKLIRLAHRSAGGWMTVQQYMPDELVSDSNDSGKNAPSGKQGNHKKKPCISQETFVNAFICYSVAPVQHRKCDTPIHR